jgi:phosphatidate cytidylyltransferase
LKNLLQRTIAGIGYLVVVIGSLFLGKYAFGAVFLLLALLALAEYYKLTDIPRYSLATVSGIVTAGLIIVLSFLVACREIHLYYLTIVGLGPLLTFIIALYSPKTDFIKDFSRVFLGIVYIILPIAIMNYLVFPAINEHEYTHRIVLGIFILVWINDTGAYVTGSIAGSHKLFPRISPKKSWEGLIGGTMLTLLPAFWMNRVMGILSIPDWIILAIVVSVFGVYGDLTESLIKRNANKKDSGTLIPGHGGVLDRLDSILFVIPVSVIYLIFRGM